MKMKKITALVTAFMTSLSISVPMQSYAQDRLFTDSMATSTASQENSGKHTVNFIGFDGSTIKTVLVADNEEIDYSAVNTDSLSKHVNAFTEIKFYKWDTDTKYTSSDLNIHALYQKAVLTIESTPAKTEYNSKEGQIDLTGLSAYITVYRQTRATDADGLEYLETEKTDISSTCYSEPLTLKEAFSGGNTAEIKVYPIGETQPVISYTITLDESAVTTTATSTEISTTSTTASTDGTSSTQTTVPVSGHTVTFLDFDGKPFKTITVKDGEKIDYSSVDTSSLSKHIDAFTEIGFSSWNIQPETVSQDTQIQALWKKMILTAEGSPKKTEYGSTSQEIDLSGLYVNITVFTQTPILNSNNEYFITNSTVDITSSCYTSPATLSEAFRDGNTAKVNVYPIGETQPIASYNISLVKTVGDVNGDGAVNSIDASHVMYAYGMMSTSSSFTVPAEMFSVYDVNSDNSINSIDASLISAYYSLASVSGKLPDWNELLKK